MKLHGDMEPRVEPQTNASTERPAERHALGQFADIKKNMQKERSTTSNTLACHKLHCTGDQT